MLQLKNHSPFTASIAVFPDERGVDSLYVALKATFNLGRTVTIAPHQLPLRMTDEFYGEAGQSSLKYGAEIHLLKPATDIIVMGSACSPDGRPVPSLDAAVQVGTRRKVIRVFGDRRWHLYENELRITPASPFTSMPLMYERAYGGIHEDAQDMSQTAFDPRNPVGAGFMGARQPAQMHGRALPNLEDPVCLINRPEDRPIPACFGFLPASWEPRRSYAGTYDEQWRQQRAPYLPEDFHNHYFNAAHQDLIYPGYVSGGEPVTISNMSPGGILTFNLPICRFEVAVQIEQRTETPVMNMETVLIEPDEMRLSLLWRGVVACDKKALKVRQIDIAMKSSTLEQVSE